MSILDSKIETTKQPRKDISNLLSICQNLIVGDQEHKILTEKQKLFTIGLIFDVIDEEKEDPEILHFQESMNYRKMKDCLLVHQDLSDLASELSETMWNMHQ